MGYFYAVLWFLVAFMLIRYMAKEHKVFYVAGAFFAVLGVWWLADSIFPDSELFSGAWRTALNVATLVALVVLSVVFFLERQRNISREAAKMKAEQERREKDAGLGDPNEESREYWEEQRELLEMERALREEPDGEPESEDEPEEESKED